ncbi:ARG81-like transcription factor [Fusarium tjaetaba]|uniref:ARG81-like transcription factor n=1 Tax=Fusarium tjaetaba TaxID=1567544 RepID=A0A8H5RIR1_9HYPO|nr:ARG81-like transcription factor [Fusarium tjaetaba]KAF5633795.1 ARG81-like transcription factor [Fusarium tjaetaba]
MPKKVERTRTFTGCRTCRSRHAKCDEAQPGCGTCKRLGLACGGYGARLFWIRDDAVRPELQQSHRGSEYRYPLFSESERRLMSDELKGSLGKRTALALLADIDSACEKSDVGDALMKGPFGVFQSVEGELTLDTIECSPDTNTDNTSTSMYAETDGFIEEIQRTDWPDQLPEDDLDIFTASLDPSFNINSEELTAGDQMNINDSMANFFVDDPMGAEGLALFSPGFISQVMGNDTTAQEESIDPNLQASMNEVVPYPRNITTPSGLPEEAEPLLRHYRQHIAGQRSTMQAKRKSPWEIIFLPCALETFAELSLWNEASHTRSSIFYTLLAHSALQLHMSKAPNSLAADWKEIGQLHNGARAFRIFLLDAERLIRLRGLANQAQNPFKSRLLHHMYTHLRVIAESISLWSEPLPESSSEIQGREQFRTFRITEEGLNMGLDPAQEKTDELGYNDIHLEVQGRWTQTLYPVIYGIPESLMTLLSQTVSLSNEKNRLETVARCNPSISEALSKHTKTLENRIWAWPSTLDPTEPVKMPTGDEDLVRHPQVRSMTLAIHQALVIYFYRRVYDMNAMILQDLVRKTLEYLEPCLSELIDDQDFATSLAWPAFVAACEAVSPDLQERALKCLGVTDDKGVYFTNRPAGVVVPLIWERRKQSGDWTTSWQSLVQESLA